MTDASDDERLHWNIAAMLINLRKGYEDDAAKEIIAAVREHDRASLPPKLIEQTKAGVTRVMGEWGALERLRVAAQVCVDGFMREGATHAGQLVNTRLEPALKDVGAFGWNDAELENKQWRELVAAICADGGHYHQKHGTEKTLNYCLLRHYALVAVADAAEWLIRPRPTRPAGSFGESEDAVRDALSRLSKLEGEVKP